MANEIKIKQANFSSIEEKQHPVSKADTPLVEGNEQPHLKGCSSKVGNENTTPNSPLIEGCPKDGVLPTAPTKPITINNISIKPNPITLLPYNVNLKDRAKALRKARNLSEVLFWMQVTKGNFYNIDFDRQRVIGNYIVDFYIKQLGLVIEIDGASHDGKEVYDKHREDFLVSLGLKVYRISVYNIMHNIHFTMVHLENYIIEQYSV